MNPSQYQTGRNCAQQLEYKIRDWLDDKAHPIGARLIDGSRKIEDDFQTQRNPRSIEANIKSFLSILEDLQRFETPVMDAQHARWLHDQYENLMHDLRKFDNY